MLRVKQGKPGLLEFARMWWKRSGCTTERCRNVLVDSTPRLRRCVTMLSGESATIWSVSNKGETIGLGYEAAFVVSDQSRFLTPLGHVSGSRYRRCVKLVSCKEKIQPPRIQISSYVRGAVPRHSHRHPPSIIRLDTPVPLHFTHRPL